MDFEGDYVAVVGAYYVAVVEDYRVVGAPHYYEAGDYYYVVEEVDCNVVAKADLHVVVAEDYYDVGLTHWAGLPDHLHGDLSVGYLAVDCAYVMSHQQAVQQEYGFVNLRVVHDL